jgi:hypothetical protein
MAWGVTPAPFRRSEALCPHLPSLHPRLRHSVAPRHLKQKRNVGEGCSSPSYRNDRLLWGKKGTGWTTIFPPIRTQIALLHPQSYFAIKLAGRVIWCTAQMRVSQEGRSTRHRWTHWWEKGQSYLPGRMQPLPSPTPLPTTAQGATLTHITARSLHKDGKAVTLDSKVLGLVCSVLVHRESQHWPSPFPSLMACKCRYAAVSNASDIDSHTLEAWDPHIVQSDGRRGQERAISQGCGSRNARKCVSSTRRLARPHTPILAFPAPLTAATFS